MKHLILAAAFSWSFLASSQAVTVDVEAYGAALNGWKKNRTARYTINNNLYRTHRPSVTHTAGGGLFVSIKIEEGGSLSSGAVSILELAFSRGGQLVSGQIRSTINGKRLDSGLVERKPITPGPQGEEGGAMPVENPTTQLINALFTRFDAELKKLDKKEGEKPRRDIFGRLGGSAGKGGAVPTAVRHNLNLFLAHVGPRTGK